MSGPAYVGRTVGSVNTAVTRTPAASNDLIVLVFAYNGTPVLSAVNDSTGAEVLADLPFAYDDTAGYVLGIGVYRVHQASAVAHTFSLSWLTSPADYDLIVIEASNVGAIDASAGSPSMVTGDSLTPATGLLTPEAAGDLLIAAIAVNHFVDSLGTWTNDFVQIAAATDGPAYGVAYLSQSTAAEVNAGVTIAPNPYGWGAALLAYSGPSSIAGAPTEVSSGTGVLSTGIKLAAAASDVTSASAALQAYFTAAAQDTSSAGGAVTTGIRLAAAVTASTAAIGALTNFDSVVLSGTLYAGTGGILDPNGTWTNGAPGVGDTVYYDPTYLTIDTDGEIVAITNDPNGNGLGFSALLQWDNADTWSFLVLVVTPWSTAPAVDTTTAIASLTTAIQLAAAAQAVSSATATFAGTGGVIAGAASDSSAATGAINTQIQLAAAITTAGTAVGSLATAIQAAASAIDDTNLSAALDDEQLAANVTDDTNATAILQTQIHLLGAVASLTNAVATLATAIRLVTSAADSSSGAGSLSTGIKAAANATMTSIAQAAFTVAAPLSAAAIASSNASGAILTAIRAFASAVSSTTARAGLKTLIKMVSQVELSSVVTGALSTGISMKALAQAASQMIAALTTGPRLQIAGAATSSSSATSPMKTRQPVSGAAAAGSTAAGSLGTGVAMGAQASAQASGSGDLFTALDPDANAVTDSSAIAALGKQGSTLFTADVLIQATPAWLVTGYGPQELIGRFPQRIGDRLIYAIDWTGWLAAYWKPNIAVAIGDVVRPWPFNGFQFRCSAPGTTGGAPPSWPAYLGAGVLDGEAQWQCAPLDNTSLTATLASMTWSAPSGILLANQRLVGLFTSVLIDSTRASPYTNYSVLGLAVASDGRQRVGKLCIQVTGGVPN